MRPYPERPVVGVGAVVLDSDRVLLVKRGHAPLKGHWSLPGGAVEIGETLEQAIAREVLEETGIAIEVGPIVEVLDRISRDVEGQVEHHFVLVDFVARPLGGSLDGGSDADDAAWVAMSELAKYDVAAVTVGVIRKAASRGFETGEHPLVW
jgi:8-oxo-dGTP diphosphatase